MRAGGGDDHGGIAATRAAARPSAAVRLRTSLGEIAARARPGGSAALGLRLSAGAERFADTVRAELDAGLAAPALVVVFACGIALYFNLPREPWWPASVAVALAAIAVTTLRRRAGHAARIAATLTALLCGVAVAAFTTARVAAPRLDHERTVTVEGRVVELDATARGGLRMTVDVARMEARGLTAEATPSRITATLTARGWRPDVGDGVRFKARLKPPEGPVLPGGYDFARRAWFERRGAGGYVLGRAEPLDLGPPPWTTRLLQPIGSLRHLIAERVRASLPGATGTIGAALMVGEQRAIPDAAAEPLRASGLTHIVSISGLHMSLVAGGVIVAIRGLLALFPSLALGYPIKKWAAGVALLATTVYLLLSGNQVAALRSHLMLSVALLAVMVDRPAITMHTVAVSAALILATDPSQALEPSFLMSYLAVIALVASYDLYRVWSAHRPPPKKEEGLISHFVGAGFRHVEGLAFSSLVAGLATAPVIAGVFFRGAPYSILANMVVLPVTGMVIMPAAVIAALLMPFGLDHWPLQAMGLGIDWMIAVGKWTAALPAGAGLIGAPHPVLMPLGIASVLWLSAWKSRIRLLGLIPAVATLALVFAGPKPDVMIGRHGAPVAIRAADGRLHVLGTRQERFDTAIWLAADGDGRPPDDADLARGWACDPLGCVFRLPGGGGDGAPRMRADVDALVDRREPTAATSRDPAGATSVTVDLTAVPAVTAIPVVASAAPTPTREAADGEFGTAADVEIAVVRHPRAFAEDCRRAALVITTLVAPPGCRDHATVVDRIDLARRGAMRLTLVTAPMPVTRTTAADSTPRPRGSIVDPTSEVEPPEALAGAEHGPSTDGPPADRTASDRTPPGDIDRPPGPPRRTFAFTDALPRFPRPWTPVDPTVERLARDAAAAEAAARPAERHGHGETSPETTPGFEEGEADAPVSPDADQ